MTSVFLRNFIKLTHWMDPSVKDEITKIFVDGSFQEGENINPISGHVYYEVQ